MKTFWVFVGILPFFLAKQPVMTAPQRLFNRKLLRLSALESAKSLSKTAPRYSNLISQIANQYNYFILLTNTMKTTVRERM